VTADQLVAVHKKSSNFARRRRRVRVCRPTMARQRTQLPAPAVFDYLVAGKPVSAQPRSGGRRRKDPRLNAWRMAVSAAIRQAIEEVASPRKYALYIDPLRVEIIWFTDDLFARNAPDLDNITKPFLDELEGLVITEDRLFQEVHLRKVELNHQFEPEPGRVFEAKASSLTEFVYVRVEPLEWDVPTRLDRSTGR
jgi:Holliday junction resolvase RusA-like endonuclease